MELLSNCRILIIDDNLAIQADFIKILTHTTPSTSELQPLEVALFGEVVKSTFPEFHIDAASSGEEGIKKIEHAQNEGKPYALAFVDIRMPPGIDGIKTIKKIFELDSDIQIVICTAFSDYSWEDTVKELGQRENLLIIKKPFDHLAVRQLSCALTKKWQLLKEIREHTNSLEHLVQERTGSLQESLSITRATLESSQNGILVVNTKNMIIDKNHRIIELLMIPEEVMDKNDATVLFDYLEAQVENPDEFSSVINHLSTAPNEMTLDQIEIGSTIIERQSQPYKIDDQIAGRIWSFRDITQRSIFENELKYQATHDSLTGLPNRTLLTDRISQELKKTKRHQTGFSVIYFDLDRFKLVNDSLSHSAGDELLKSVANRIKTTIRGEDTFARLSGDEFVVVAEYGNNTDDIGRIALKILNSLSKPFEISGTEIVVTASMGISSAPNDGFTADDLMSKADMAMYLSKEQGGNQLQFYSQELGKRNIERLGKETELRKALSNNEFILCYQPQVDIYTNRITSVEALIRWKHPSKGLIFPLQFIPLAEETGLITPMGEWVLREACIQNKKWQQLGYPKISIAVNVAAHQIKYGNFPQTVKTVLNETGLEAKYLELELSENIIINTTNIIEIINELKKLGVNIALDDFGSGCSSLNYLRKIPIDRLKIDQSFVKNIKTNRSDEAIIQAIISIAREMNFDVLAEGVETSEQLNFLRSKNCSSAQGYLYGKPMFAEDIDLILSKLEHLAPEEPIKA